MGYANSPFGLREPRCGDADSEWLEHKHVRIRCVRKSRSEDHRPQDHERGEGGGRGAALYGALTAALYPARARRVPKHEMPDRLGKQHLDQRQGRLALLRHGLIPWLAGIDPDTGAPRRRVARLSEIPAEARPLIDLLIEQRLLSTDLPTAAGAARPSGPRRHRPADPASESQVRATGAVGRRSATARLFPRGAAALCFNLKVVLRVGSARPWL